MSGKLTIKLNGQLYPMTNTKKALEKVGKMWRKNARISLKKQDRINTGKLYDSIPVDVFESEQEFFVDITPKVNYWQFVDKGVQGASRNIFPEQGKSPFKFGSGKGPKGLRGAIDKWVIQKGIDNTRDEKGRFIERKSLVFMISRAIYNRGLKPALFITKTKQNIQKHVAKTIAPAMGKDYANAMRKDLKRDQNLDVK
jgi:hypothetical protein